MKRMVVFGILIALCMALAACDPGSYVFEQQETESGLVRVELIRYDNPKQDNFLFWAIDHFDDLRPLDLSKMTVLKTLEPERQAEFVAQLCQADILHKYYVFDSPSGQCLKLTYENGEFLIINTKPSSFHGYIGRYSADGGVLEYIGCFSSLHSYEKLRDQFFADEP